MASESSHFLHIGVIPDYDLVETIAMSGDEFISGIGKHKVTDLTSCFYGIQLLE